MSAEATRGSCPRHGRGRRFMARAVALLLTVSGSGLYIAAVATPAQAAITAPFNQVFSADTTGNIQIRGNTILSCQNAATSCAAARAQLNQNDNSFFMTYIDSDSDPTTFDSSSSTVNIPSGGSVLFAALIWGGNTTAGGSLSSAAFGTGTAANSPTPANAGQVKLMVPGSSAYTTVTSTRTSFLSGSTGNYQGYANITSTVQAAGNGSYTVANVQTATGTNIQGGWGLAIAYSNPTDPPRDLTIFSGFGTVGAGDVVDIPVSGFKTPPSGAVTTTLGSISYEGDAASVGDQLQLGNTIATLQNVADALHPVANSFTSVISDLGVDNSTRNPDYLNQLGFDAATFNVNGFLTNGSTSADIRMTSASSGGETYYPGVITFATDLYSPAITATKTVTLVAKASGNTQAGVAEPGDTLRYTINATNTGQDSSAGTVFTDGIPANTTYKAGSITSGGIALTDATGDDIGHFDSVGNQVVVDVGSGATPTVGGTLAPSASIAPVTFDVTVNAGVPNGAAIPNAAQFAYSGATTGIAVTGASNAVLTPAVRHHSELSITKTANLTTVQRGAATPVTYTLTATNAGPYDDPGATITDTLPTGAVVVSATPSVGSCTTPAGSVVCTIGALAIGASATVAIVVTLDAVADPATDTATVVGGNLDSFPADSTASRATAVDTAPVAHPDSATTSGGSATVSVLANDTDADADVLSTSAGPTAPTRGSIVVNGNGTITYAANAGQAGTDTFSYVASDGRGGTSTALVTITIPNAPPVGVADSASTTPGTPVTIPVLANDTDPNIPTTTQTLSVTAVTQPAGSKGVVTTNGTTLTFTPSGTFLVGTATFSYTVSDGAGGTATGSVTVTVPNGPPVAVIDAATVVVNGSVDIPVLANDTDPNGDTLTIASVTAPAHGTATIQAGGIVHYVPTAGYNGTDTFTYTVSDGNGGTDTAIVTVGVGDQPPVANADAAIASGLAGSSVTVDVLANDTDPDGDALSIASVTSPAHGTATIVAGKVVYTPSATYVGTDSFTYTVSDGRGGTSSATVTVDVQNRNPVAHPDVVTATTVVSTTINVLGNDTDADGETLSVLSVSPTSTGGGTVTLSGGVVHYTSAVAFTGADTFTYVVTDPRGGTATATVTVNVSSAATPPDANPVAVDDTTSTTPGVPVTVDVLANDSDPDVPGSGQVLTVSSVHVVSGSATVSITAGGQVLVTPNAGYIGDVVAQYTVADGAGGSATGQLTVHVAAAPAGGGGTTVPQPDAVDDVATTPFGSPITIDVLANDTSNQPGVAPTIVAITAPVDGTGTPRGTVTLVGGQLQYVPPSGFAGTVTFRYTITNPLGGTGSAAVTVTVQAKAAVVSTVVVTIVATTPAVDLNPATEATGHGDLTLVSVSQPANGASVTVVDGHLVVTRAPGFVGATAFTYVVVGADGTQVTVTVFVHVLGESIAANVATLPFTGADMADMGLAGLVLVSLGVTLMWVSRRRGDTAVE